MIIYSGDSYRESFFCCYFQGILFVLEQVEFFEDDSREDFFCNYYYCKLLFGFIFMVFEDVVKEGDGQRIYEFYKFFLLIYKFYKYIKYVYVILYYFVWILVILF